MIGFPRERQSVRRRKFISLIGAAVAGWPLLADAQQPEHMRRVGMLLGGTESDPQMQAGLEAFSKALAALGWTDGHNIHIDYRWGHADVDRMRTLAKELVDLSPDLMVGVTTQAVAALHGETKTIPIVFTIVSDPVGSGFVASLPRPGGNITGFINLESSLSGKWIDVLRAIASHTTRAALLYNPQTASYFKYYLQPFEASARSAGIEPVDAPVRTTADIERVVANLAEKSDAGLVVMPDVFTAARQNVETTIALAARYHIPTIYPYRFMVEPGGLISYGVDNADLYRRSADYVDRILKGAKPADLPVQLPTKFELVINLKTAKALGLTIPEKLLATADAVIE